MGFSLCLTSCQDEPFFDDSNKKSNSNLYEGGLVLENPYATANMKMALDTIKAKITRGEYVLNTGENSQRTNSSVLEDFNISTSHKYIKFTPQSEDDIAVLKQDSTLILSDYPLDYEFDEAFHDNRPELPEGQFPEYFTAVPVGRSLPNVSNLPLGDLYIPEDDIFFNGDTATPITEKTIINNEEDLLHHLLYESYSLVGKEQQLLEDGEIVDPTTQQTRWIFGRKWYPSGLIGFWDGVGGTMPGGQICEEVLTGYDNSACFSNSFISQYDCAVPIYTTVCTTLPNTQGGLVSLQGAQVLMRQWFTVRSGITNAAGYFSTDYVRGKARYVIQWERYQYSIRNGSLFQAETRGPKVKNAPWFHPIFGGDDEYHAMIHTAAHDYYYGGRFGLKSPPKNGFLQNQIKIAARESAPWGVPSSFSHERSEITFGLLAQIHIKAWGRNSDEVYGTTIHELAHASHWTNNVFVYDGIVQDAFYGLSPAVRNNNRRLLESWPTTVEIAFALHRYGTVFNVANYQYRDGNLQNVMIQDENHYTSGGWDMLDDVNQRVDAAFGNGDLDFPVDNVNGYNITQLENALFTADSWWKWRDNIIELYDNPTEGNLFELFDNWPN